MKNLMEVMTMTRSTIMCISFVAVSLMVAGQSYAAIDPATTLGVWLLDEGSGNVAADSSGNGNDGTLVGPVAWIPGQFGTALTFTGSGTYVNCGNPESFNVNVFSVSFWYNFPATQGWNHMISRGSHGSSGTPGSVNWGVMMYSAQQTILYEIYENTAWRGLSVTTTAGQWHHVVATYDLDRMQLYHDGQLAGSSGADVLLDPRRPFVIGARSDAGGPAPSFNGSIDEVGYFNTVLTAEDVQTIMTNGLSAIAQASNLLARRPAPKDGATVAQTWLTISWTAGDSAVSHDMYLGETFEDVNAGTGNTFRGNLASPLLLVGLGMPDDPYPAGLVPGTTYYWRVDEVEADASTKHKGPVWSFWISPKKAYNPDPPSGTKYVATDAALSWTAGLGAKLHYVHFGDKFEDVNNATTGGTATAATTFTPPGPLAKGKTYYWRADAFEAGATQKGDVWSFTTLPDVPVTDPNLVAWYKFEAGAGTKVLDFSGHDNHGTIVPGPRGTVQWVQGLFNMALEFLGDSQGHVEMPPTIVTTAKGSILMWINTTQGNSANNDEGMLWWACQIANGDGYGGENEIHINIDEPGNGELDFFLEEDGAGSDITINGPEVGGTGWRHVAATWDLADGCRLYVDGVEVGYAAHNTNVKSFAAMRLGRPVGTGSGNCFYDGLMDDVRLFDHAISAAKVAEIMSKGEDPLRAGALNPSSGALTPINRATPLNWAPGEKATQHDVYFALDKAAVADADASDTTGVYRGRQSATSYTPPEGVQMAGGPYYWRIDEVNTDGTITTGAVWNFMVADYVLVEDFESYNDIPTGQAGSNLVYETWLDGYGTTTNGSTMGYPTGASMETATVHGGSQAVPLIYDNSGTAAFSEAERTFAAQNWTSNGVQTLSLWFYGDSANVPGQLYVKINGVKVLYDGDASNLKKPVWQVWNINLASVGVNLQSVTRLAIGIDTKGATGTLLLDDIRLYPYARELITPVQPDPAGLVARFAFEGNANDSVGGHNGTPNGGPTYAAGKIGQAISLDGLDDHVVVGSVGISGAAPRTIAGWAKATSMTFPAWVNIFGFTGPSGNNGHFDIELVGSTSTTTLGWYGLHVYGWEQDILPVDLTEWHHLAASYDGTTTKWYGDGVLIGSDDARVLNTPDNVHIGKRDDNTNFFPGMVDEVQIFSRALSDAEVAGLAGMTKPFDKPF